MSKDAVKFGTTGDIGSAQIMCRWVAWGRRATGQKRSLVTALVEGSCKLLPLLQEGNFRKQSKERTTVALLPQHP